MHVQETNRATGLGFMALGIMGVLAHQLTRAGVSAGAVIFIMAILGIAMSAIAPYVGSFEAWRTPMVITIGGLLTWGVYLVSILRVGLTVPEALFNPVGFGALTVIAASWLSFYVVIRILADRRDDRSQD